MTAIAAMDRPALLALWTTTLGGAVPRSMSQPVLRRVLAWEVQARAWGGLPATVRRTLERLASDDHRDAARTKAPAASLSPRLKPGGRLLREWAGVTHVVDVVEGGFVWRGTRHRSLTAIAQAITGAHWSGPRFFGLQAPAPGTASGPGAKTRSAPGAKTTGVPSAKGRGAADATGSSAAEPASDAPRARRAA